jgi:hypothetical protein
VVNSAQGAAIGQGSLRKVERADLPRIAATQITITPRD